MEIENNSITSNQNASVMDVLVKKFVAEEVHHAIAKFAGLQTKCPFADLDITPSTERARSWCPFHAHKTRPEPHVHHAPPLSLHTRSFKATGRTAQLLDDIGGGEMIREATTRFYARAFEDFTLAQFMTVYDDGAVAHGKRFADWTIEKMGGEGSPWTDSGRHGMRQPTHYKAWNSTARDPKVRGEHFKLDDCRVWMRIHFWAFREVGLAEHKAFWNWYVSFIGHFIAIYERRAPPYAKEAAEWSADSKNLEAYVAQGNKMVDVIGVKRYYG